MLLGVFYACVCLAATTAWIWVQFGWQPPFIALWDSRAQVYFGLLCLFSAWAAAIGIVGQTPWRRLPKLLRTAPFVTATLLPGFAFIDISNLSQTSTPQDVISKLGFAAGISVGLGLIAGLLHGLVPDSEAERAAPKYGQAGVLAILAVIVVVGMALLLIPRARDDVSIRDFAQFGSAQGCFEIGVSTGGLSDDEFGIIKITAHGNVNALILERGEWSAVAEFWSKAERAQSGNWRVIGDMHDTEASDPSRLVLFAGKGVRFVISSPHHQTVTFDLAPENFARFDAAVAKVGTTLRD